MSQGMKKRTMGFSDETVKKAAARNPFDQFVTNLASGASGLLAGGQDVISSIQNLSQQNQLNKIKKGDLGFSPEEAGKQAYKLSSGLEERKIADATRKQEQAIKKIEQKGLATPLADKSRIVNNLASGEIKKVKTLQSDLDSQGNQALDAYAKQLKEDGLGESEIQASLEEARKQVKQANSQLTAGEAQNTKQLLADTVGGNLEDVNKFKLQRRFNDLDALQGKGDKTAANIGSMALETASRGVVQPLVNLGGELTSLAAGGADLLTGNRFKLGEQVGQQQQQYNQAFDNSLGNEQDLGTIAQQFAGNSAPFLLMPETTLGRNLTAQAMRGVRALPFASKGVQNVASKIIGAGIKEGIQDTPLSLVQTAGDLTGAVQRGELTPQQALQQAPGAIGVNALGDFVGAGVLRGAGDLAGQALKGGLPKIETARGEAGAAGVLEKPPEAKPLTVEDIKKNTYKESKQKLDQVTQQQKQITQAIKQAETSGDYQAVGQLKQQAQALKVEGKQLKTTVNNLELEGLQNNPSLNREVTASPDVVASLNRIFGDTSASDKTLPGNNEGLGNALNTPARLDNNQGKTQPLPQTEAQLLNPKTQAPGYTSQQVKPDIQDNAIGKAGGRVKAAQKDLKNQYSDVLNKETAISEKPVRDGLEELGFEVKTNAKGEKYAQLGNVKVGLKDMPPPYSLSGLKSSLKERIASAKAAKDIQTGKVSDIEGVRSEFLDDAQASKYLDQLDGEALYQEKQFIDSIKNAKTPQELEAIAAKQPDLFTYDESGNPSKYMKEYETKETQLNAPRPAKSLGTKVLEEGQEDNLKAIRRTLGEYTPKEFQEAQRNPSQLKKITEVYEDLPKDTERVMSQAAKVKQKLNDVEASLVDNKDHLNKLFGKEGLQAVTVDIGGQKYTIQKPEKGEDKPILNSKGRAAREFIYDELQKEGKVKFDYDKGVQLAIQPTATPASKAKRFGTKTLDEAAIEHIQLLREKAVLDEKESFFKEKIMNEIAPKLQNKGLDHIWKNGEGDTSFAIKRNKRGVDFTSPEAKDEFKAKEAALLTKQENVKVQKGEYKTAGLSEKQALGINARTKQGKADYEAFKERVRKDAQIETALETGEVKTTELADSIVQKAADEWKKPDDTKGKQFALNPAMGAALLNSDTALIGLRLFRSLVDKALGKGEVTSGLYEGFKAFIGRAESYATRLRNSKVPALRKMVDEYADLAGREHAAMGYLRTVLNKEQVESIGAALKENGFQALQRKIDNGYSIEGINSVEEFEALKGFLKNRSARAKLIEGTIEQAKLNKLPEEDMRTLEAFLTHETKVEKGTMKAVADIATDFMYFRALWNNINSSTLALTDPLTKLIPEYGLKKTAVSFGQVFNKKVRNSPLFKAYNAGDSGTFIDALTGRQAKGGLAKAWESVKKASTFNLVAEASQDMGLLAHAQQFNDYWKKKTGQKIDILQDYNGSSDASIEFALTHNQISNKLYGSGTGTVNMSEIEGAQLLKPFLTFMSEPLRFQKRITEWQSIMKQAGEKNATPEMKEAGKRARNATVSFVALTVLLGGSTALKNYGGIVGSTYNAALNFMSDDEREATEKFINAAQLTRYLNVDIGEKLGVGLLNRKGGQSLAEDFLTQLNGDVRLPVVDIFKQFPRDVEKAKKQFAEGKTEDAWITTAKILFSAPARTVEKILKKLNQQPISVYVDTGAPFPEKAEKQVDWADILSYSANATDIKKQILQTSQVKKDAKKNLENIEFKRAGKGSIPKFTQEGYTKFKGDVDRYMKLNPDANRNEIEQKLIKSARDKWLEKNPEMKKPTKPKRFKPVPVLIGDS